MRVCVLRFGLVFLGFLSVAASGWALTPDERDMLRRRWIVQSYSLNDPDEVGAQVTEERFDELLMIVRNDPASTSLVSDVVTRLGFSRMEELRSFVLLCDQRRTIRISEPSEPDEPLHSNELEKGAAGHLSVQFDTYTQDLNPSGHYFWNLGPRGGARSGQLYREYSTSTQRLLTVMTMPMICMSRRGTLLDAYLTFVHEIKHLQGALNDLRTKIRPENLDALEFRDANDFAEKYIESSGGEVDAFATETRAALYLERHDYISSSHSALVRYFDSRGEIIDLRGLKLQLLDGQGYRTSFLSFYPELVRSSLSAAQIDLDALRALLRRISSDPQHGNFYNNYRSQIKIEIDRLEHRVSVLSLRH